MSEPSSTAASTRTPAEFVTLGITLVLLTSLIGTMLWLWITDAGELARFTVSVSAVRNEGQHFYLPVTVTNTGDETASQVKVEGRLPVDGDTETADTTFDFVPGHSQSEAVLIFGTDPEAAAVRVVSYQEP